MAEAVLVYAVRDHDPILFQKRLDTLSELCRQMNGRYGEHTVSITIKEEYRNMRPIIEACPHLIEHAAAAVRAVGLTPKICPSRGGTDGARLSFKGLPCPNLGVGGYAYHGPMEHITAESIETASQILIEIVRSYAKKPL